MEDKKIRAHRVYFYEKYNKPYVDIYRIINGKSTNYEKYIYALPNKRDYKYINGATNAVTMSCTKFKAFRKANNIKISECEYSTPTYDDSFFYNSSKKQFFVKVTKKIYETFGKDDVVYKYNFSSKNRKLQIGIDKFKFNILADAYETEIEEKIKKRKARLTRKINRAITQEFGKYDNLFPSYLEKILKTTGTKLK